MSIAKLGTVSPSAASAVNSLAELTGEHPLRGELLGVERLEAHARRLAEETPAAVTPGKPLLRRFARIGRDLVRAHNLISEAYRQQEKFGSEAEWLLDNFHIITAALHEVQ